MTVYEEQIIKYIDDQLKTSDVFNIDFNELTIEGKLLNDQNKPNISDFVYQYYFDKCYNIYMMYCNFFIATNHNINLEYFYNKNIVTQS